MIQAGEQVLWGCKTMCERGYVLGTSGNISARIPGENAVVITPTSLPYDELTVDDLVIADLDGAVRPGTRKPSIELSLHLAVYRQRPDVMAVVHTHSAYATSAGALQGIERVPLLDIEAAIYLGGDIMVAPFAPPGSAELAERAAAALGTNAGVILESHGAVGVGKSMRAAMTAADIVERASMIFMTVAAAGAPKPLPGDYLKTCCEESAKARGVINIT